MKIEIDSQNKTIKFDMSGEFGIVDFIQQIQIIRKTITKGSDTDWREYTVGTKDIKTTVDVVLESDSKNKLPKSETEKAVDGLKAGVTVFEISKT
jgi:hypothetical protein